MIVGRALRRRIVLRLRFCFVLCALSMTCGAADEAAVRIGYSKLRISLPVFVAQENGYFRAEGLRVELVGYDTAQPMIDRKSTRLNSSHRCISYAVFCLKKK